MKKYILYLLIILAFSSCETTITEIEITKSAPQLVVYCFISPQAAKTKVQVKLSQPTYINSIQTDEYPIVENATVTIKEQNGLEKIINYNDLYDNYEIDSSEFKIKEGSTYYITVTTPDGKRATSHCTVPSNKNIDINFEFFKQINEENWFLKCSFKDTKGEGDFYKVKVFARKYNDTYLNLGSGLINDYFSDKNIDNEEIKISKYIQTGYSEYNSFDSIDIVVYKTDLNYYKYFSAISNYSDDELFSEPTFVHLNMEGGFGLFGAYLLTKKSFKLNNKK